MDTSQYLELFIDETQEHLQSLNEHILELIWKMYFRRSETEI